MTPNPSESHASASQHSHPAPIVHGSKYLGIQSLRSVAALVVVIMHSMFYENERLGGMPWKFESGVSGVDIFFVISGFVMYYSSMKLIDQKDGWKIFAARRLTRIVPLYWIATSIKLITILLIPSLVLHTKLNLLSVILSYLFLPSRNIDGFVQPLLGVGWTLIFEMFFYTVFAIGLYMRVNLLRFVGLIMALCSILAIFRQPSWPPATVYFDSMTLEFFVGMVLAKMCLSGKKLPPVLSLVLFPFVLAGMLSPWHLPGPRIVEWGLPAFLLCWCAASAEQLIHNKIPRFVVLLADASYALYLFHPLIAPAIPTLMRKAHLQIPVISITASVCLALLAGCAAYKWIDVPIMEHFRRRMKRPSAVVAVS